MNLPHILGGQLHRVISAPLPGGGIGTALLAAGMFLRAFRLARQAVSPEALAALVSARHDPGRAGHPDDPAE